MKKHEYHHNGKTITSIGLDDFDTFIEGLSEDLYMFPEFIRKSRRTPVQLVKQYPDLDDQYQIDTDHFYLYDLQKPELIQVPVLPGSNDLSMLADETFIGLSNEDQVILLEGVKKLTQLAYEKGLVEYLPKSPSYKGETPSKIIRECLRKILKEIGQREWIEALSSASDCYTAATIGWMQCYHTIAVPEAPATFRQMLTTVAEIFKDIKIKPSKRSKSPQLRYKRIPQRTPAVFHPTQPPKIKVQSPEKNSS